MRYIDADELYETVTKKYSDIVAGCYPYNIVAYDMARLVKEAPTADVVPKSEVERLKICYEGSQKTIKGLTEMIREKTKELAKLETHLELHYREKSLNNLIAKEKADVAREIFEEIEKHSRFQTQGISPFRLVIDDNIYKEIKNKYTGEQI